MTALTKYARLETVGLWRATAESQRREVVVCIGDATLVIKDPNDQALAHWSLAAVERANPGVRPAIFHPDGDPGETVELDEDEAEMIDAIETLRTAINKSRPRPGRLRSVGMFISIAAVVAAAVFWLPDALRDHTLTVVPEVKRVQMGRALLGRIERVSGPACGQGAGIAALAQFGGRLGAKQLAVLPAMTHPSLHLPGSLVVLNRTVIEDFEEPDVAAGHVLAQLTQEEASDPLADFLNVAGLRENFRLLTTGEVSDRSLDAYAEHLMTQAQPAAPLAPLLARFETAALRSTPYAYALDITGETTLPLIEGDPMSGRLTEPLLSDAEWLELQSICGG